MAYCATPHGTKYALDEEGFVKVMFLEPKRLALEAPPRKKSESTTRSDDISLSRESQVDEPSVEGCLPKGTVAKCTTETSIKDLEYTNMLRLAYVSPKAADIIYKCFGLRGIPLRWGLTVSGALQKGPWTLQAHQILALRWMKARMANNNYGLRGGIISLAMGLGKTLTALVHILSNKESTFPSLVIASKTIMLEWKKNGVEKFFGENIKVLYLHKDNIGKNTDNLTRAEILEYDIVVTTYDVVLSAARKTKYHEEGYVIGDDHSLMKGKLVTVGLRTLAQADRPKEVGLGVIYCTPWEHVVCDESQTFANPDTATYKAIMGIYGRYKWCLTGTPIRNYQLDIWSQLRFCGYDGAVRSIDWKRRGLSYMSMHKLREAIFTMSYSDAKITLPIKSEHTIYISLDNRERDVYAFMLKKTKESYDKMMKKMCSFASVLALFTRLRQCAIDPYLITSCSKREKLSSSKSKADKEALALINSMPDGSLSKWCHNKKKEGIVSSKIRKTVEILSKIPKSEKALVFSMFTSCLDLLGDTLKEVMPDYSFIQIDGDTVGQERETLLDQFRADPSVRALFLTYKVGGQGLNLTEATHCIPIEPWWTNAVYRQAITRCWRFGQTKEVHVHNIITKDTIEEKVIDIAKQKDAMASEYLDGTTQSVEKVGLDKYTLGRMLGIYG